MLDARKARKRAEADVQLLANRLQHLRFEEERALEQKRLAAFEPNEGIEL